MRRYPASSLPTTPSELNAWCQERWAEKEVRLRHFYAGQPRAFHREGPTRVPPCKTELRVSLIKAVSLLYWSCFIPLCMAGLWLWPMLRVYFVLMVAVYMGQLRLGGGLELIELACHRYWTSVARDRKKKELLEGKKEG